MIGYRLPLTLSGAIALLGTASAVTAQGIALGVRLGTPGISLEATGSPTRLVNLRGNFSFGSLSTTTSLNLSSGDVSGDTDFSARVRFRSAAALVDLHPGGGGFRVTGGIVCNRNSIRLVAKPTGDVTINGQTYTFTNMGELVADGELGRAWVPYAGIGLGNAVASGKRVTFMLDLGVFFQGQPWVDLSAHGIVAGTPGLQEDLYAAEDDINANELNRGYLKYYPVVSFGIAVKVF
jgi:hypothetical protein